MPGFLQRLCSPVFLPLGWTVLTIVLLCLPGSAIPGNGIFAIKGIDKIVHIILFGGIELFWGYFWLNRQSTREQWRKLMILIAFLVIGLGIGLEFLQLYYIPGRTFDIADILADAAGALLALLFLFTSKEAIKS